MKSKSSQFALPYLTLTMSVFVCLGAISDASATTVNLNLRSGEMALQSREEKLIADFLSDLAKQVQQHKPKPSITSAQLLTVQTANEQRDTVVIESQQDLLSDPGRYLHQTLLNLPPPKM
ncbi:hypothetical protein JD969_20255 [Planctomycetota bacterium]|nr:hypothetical protein JD969_20255 [Planctomycetota bacterium]